MATLHGDDAIIRHNKNSGPFDLPLLHATKSSLIGRWESSRLRCTRLLAAMRTSTAVSLRLEFEDPIPVVLHAYDDPALPLRLIVERLREGPTLVSGNPRAGPYAYSRSASS